MGGSTTVPLEKYAPSSPEALSLSIGQVGVALHCAEPRLREPALRRYAEFLDAREGALPVRVNGEPSLAGLPAEFQYGFDDARVRFDGVAAHFAGVRHEYALDSLLRVLLSWLLLPREGFLLHASTVERNSRAYVFTGRSGAGKSTVASLSPPGSVLTDEISLLRREGGVWRAYGTPFWGEFRAAGSNRSAPVAAIFTLVKSAENKVRPLSAREALRVLLPNVLFFSSEQRANAQLLEILTGAVAEVPCRELCFRRDAGFWEVLPA